MGRIDTDMRDELIYAVVYAKRTCIPGDERSRTNPGHGYPAYTQEDQIFTINTLSAYYGFVAPIWLDNSEAVTQLLETKGQQIKLYVSEADKALRIERVREAVTA